MTSALFANMIVAGVALMSACVSAEEVGRGLQLLISSTTAPPSTSAHFLNVQDFPHYPTPAPLLITSTVFGITMQPGIYHGHDTTSSGPNFRGYGIAAAAGVGVAGAATAAAFGIHHLVEHVEQQQSRIAQAGTLGAPILATKRAAAAATVYARQGEEAAEDTTSSSSGNPVLFTIVALSAGAGVLGLCVGAFLFYSRKRKRGYGRYDGDVYSGGGGYLGGEDYYDDEDQPFFGGGGFTPTQAMYPPTQHMYPPQGMYPQQGMQSQGMYAMPPRY